jgi:hypothetical protein
MEKKTPSEKKSIPAMAWASYRQEAKALFPTAFNFAMVLIAVFALGIYFPPSLYLTIPLVVLPFFFAFQMTTAYLRKGTAMDNAQFWRFVSSYFQVPFVGCYRVIIHLLFSFLWSLLAAWVVSLAYYGIASSVNPDFVSVISDLTSYLEAGDVTSATNALQNSTEIIYFVNTTTAVELSVFSFAFFHQTALWGSSPFLRGAIIGGDARMCNQVYVGGIRSVRGPFMKDYFGALWPGLLLFLVGYLGGGAILMRYSSDVSQWVASGLAGASLLLLPFLPYYFHVMGYLIDKYRNAFANYAIKLAQNTLHELEENKKLSEEEASELKKSIVDAQEEQAKAEAEEKKESSETSKKDDSDDSSNKNEPK